MSKFVDHGSVLAAMRTSKYTVLPSGENVYSLSSPNGLEGMSPSMPRLSRVGSAEMFPSGVNLAMYNCERRPSDQVSQWRTNSLSYTLPLALLAALASRRCLVQARFEQSANASSEITICLPSADSLKLFTSMGKRVTCCGADLCSAVRRHTCTASPPLAR